MNAPAHRFNHEKGILCTKHSRSHFWAFHSLQPSSLLPRSVRSNTTTEATVSRAMAFRSDTTMKRAATIASTEAKAPFATSVDLRVASIAASTLLRRNSHKVGQAITHSGGPESFATMTSMCVFLDLRLSECQIFRPTTGSNKPSVLQNATRTSEDVLNSFAPSFKAIHNSAQTTPSNVPRVTSSVTPTLHHAVLSAR